MRNLETLDKTVLNEVFKRELRYKPQKTLYPPVREGFTNTIFDIDNKFMVKICTNLENELNFRKEVKLAKAYSNQFLTTRPLIVDLTKSVLEYPYYIYEKIPGGSLFEYWGKLGFDDRKEAIKAVFHIIRKINRVNIVDILGKMPSNTNWRQLREKKSRKYLMESRDKELVDNKYSELIESYFDEFFPLLQEASYAPSYTDLHFGNILFNPQDHRISGLIDLENVEYISLDYVLDTLYRMINYPNLYSPETLEKYQRVEDYQPIKTWVKKYYHEVFKFRNLDHRLGLYDLEYTLKMLLAFPEVDFSNRLDRVLKKQ